MEHAVLMMAYGGPSGLDDVEPYLRDVMNGRTPTADVVQATRERYATIGGRSPLLEITRAQATALQERLNADSQSDRYQVYVGMRHWRPYINDAVSEIVAAGLRHVIAICMAPHYSRLSIGEYFEDLNEVLEIQRVDLDVIPIRSWHTSPLLIRAIAAHVAAACESVSAGDHAGVQVLFTAHSLPAAAVEGGDPYDAQLHETARLVADFLNLPAGTWQLCYQSAGRRRGPWLGPDVEDVIVDLADKGHKMLVVAPIGFVADNLETLFDLDIECRDLAAAHSAHLVRSASLNTAPAFIAALAAIVQQATRE